MNLAASLGAKLHDIDMSSWFAWEHYVLIPMSTVYQGVGKGWQNHQGISRMLNWHVKLRGSVVKNASKMTHTRQPTCSTSHLQNPLRNGVTVTTIQYTSGMLPDHLPWDALRHTVMSRVTTIDFTNFHQRSRGQRRLWGGIFRVSWTSYKHDTSIIMHPSCTVTLFGAAQRHRGFHLCLPTLGLLDVWSKLENLIHSVSTCLHPVTFQLIAIVAYVHVYTSTILNYLDLYHLNPSYTCQVMTQVAQTVTYHSQLLETAPMVMALLIMIRPMPVSNPHLKCRRCNQHVSQNVRHVALPIPTLADIQETAPVEFKKWLCLSFMSQLRQSFTKRIWKQVRD